mgnify:CR=1 FL=1
MPKHRLLEIDPHRILVRDARTGIARVEDGTTGTAASCHPNIAQSGSIRGMKQRGYWDRHARTVRAFGFVYNIDEVVCSDELDDIARAFCWCGGACDDRMNDTARPQLSDGFEFRVVTPDGHHVFRSYSYTCCQAFVTADGGGCLLIAVSHDHPWR